MGQTLLSDVTWLIEDGPINENIDKLVTDIYLEGMKAKVIKWRPFHNLNEEQPVDFYKNPCICIGSIAFAKESQRTLAIPGPFCSWYKFEWQYYAHNIGQLLFNSDYILCTLGQLVIEEEYMRMCSYLYPNKIYQQIFIRPSNGHKSFTGQIVKSHEDIKMLMQTNQPNTLVVISSKKRLGAEYRFFCTKDKIITGSQYRGFNNESLDAYINIDDGKNKAGNAAIAYCMQALISRKKDWPDDIFVIDVGFDQDSRHYGIIELNSFACSGQYASNTRYLAQAVGQIALRIWNQQ